MPLTYPEPHDLKTLEAGSSGARDLRLLEHIADAQTTWVEDLSGLDVDRADLSSVLRDCEQAGYVELEPGSAMTMTQAHPGSRLTSAGTQYVEEIRELRAAPVERAHAVRVELLLWLYDTDDHLSVTTTFLNHGRTYYGIPFTEKDVMSAAKHLAEFGLINGLTTWQSDGPLRVEITAVGRTVVEDHDADPKGARAQTSTPVTNYTQHIHSSTGSIAQGDHATSITHQGLRPEDIRTLRETFYSGLAALDDPDDRADVQLAVDDLLNDLQTEGVDPEQVERRTSSLNRLTRRIGNTAVTVAVTEGIKQALELMPGIMG